jgi:glycosyltransferase involved in cell wall biosynthesis
MISILLAAYNGEKYIAEQIESLLGQTQDDFKLYIRDDCSTDGTWEIIRNYEKRYHGKIIVKQNNRNSGSSKHNFIGMMIDIKDDYIMLCDQDDIWLPDKIEKTISKLKAMEAQYGKEKPLLVHTDLRVVDENLNVISPSCREAMNVGYERTGLRQILIQNVTAGCTAAYNRALAELIRAEPAYMVMHDWWLMLTATAFGKIGYLDEQTILYRQHGANEIGANDVRKFRYKFNRLMHGGEVRKAINQTYDQAASFQEMYLNLLNEEQQVLLSAYRQIPAHNKIMRCLMIIRLGVLKHGIERKIANFLFI